MNKTDLIAALAQSSNLTKADASRCVDSFLDIIQSTLSAGESVTLPGFGAFSVKDRAARTGRNPQTGAAIKIPAKKVVKFRVAKACKEAILGKK